jgi:DNA ligase-1
VAHSVRTFARICDEIAATPAKSTKIERLAEYFRSLEGPELCAVARFFTGNPLAAADERKLAIGGRTIVSAAHRVWDFDESALSLAYRATGDLGEALARLVHPPRDTAFFAETLTPRAFAAMLDELAATSGKSAGRRREGTCERIFRACTEPREVAYVVKILTGDLRIGLREGLVLDAVAKAFDCDPNSVRRAAMAAGDVGAVAEAARSGGLDAIAVRYGAPIGFMLASPIAFGSDYGELAAGSWLVEDKFDGVRAQAHKEGARVMLFSRTFKEISRPFPEIAAALARCPGDFIADGEIVARRNGRVLPFRYLQSRLQRLEASEELRRAVPVAFVAFDLLAANGRFMLDEPLLERRSELTAHIAEGEHVAAAPWTALEAGAATVAQMFDAARERGNEGLMFKRADSPYAPGRRGKWWLKLKRELSTLDAVVVGVEWGHGKRKGVLSDYTFAVRRGAGSLELATLGKAYSGLTDAEIAELTPWFLAHQTGMLTRRALAVSPEIVIEIAFDIIAKSGLHAGGFSLRFPRIVRLRPDKPASDIATLADVEALYREMLQREGVAE